MGMYTEVKKEMLSFLEGQFSPKEFYRSRQIFYRKVPIGKQMLHISFLKEKDEINIVVDVDIRHDELENLFSTLEKIPHNTLSASIGTELGKLSHENTIMWAVNDISNVPSIGIEIISRVSDVGWSFFEEYSSLEKIFDVLMDDKEIGQTLCSIPHVRAKKALTAAFLLQRRDFYNNIIESKTKFLESISNPYLSEFLEFAFRLKNRFTKA